MALNGYEKTYEVLVPRLSGCDFERAAADLGLMYKDGIVHVDFLLRHYTIDETGVHEIESTNETYERANETKSTTDSDSDVNRKSVLIYYLTWGGRGEPAYQFKLFHSFSHGIFSGGATETNWMSASLRRILSEGGDGATRFEETMNVFGATQKPVTGGATSIWSYQVLPKIPVEIYYYEADEEFPCEVKVMYDSTALNFVPFETLGVLGSCLHNEIKRTLLRLKPV